MSRESQRPINIIPSDGPGTNIAPVLQAPPVAGVDWAVPAYVSLGSAVVPVSAIEQGAANWATGQVTLSASASQIVSSRATRRAIMVTNTDAAIKVYVGTSNAVTTSTGQIVPVGLSVSIPITAAVWAIAASGSPVITYTEVWD